MSSLKSLTTSVALLCAAALCGPANAELQGRNKFGLASSIEDSVFLYDTNLNVTWLRDANYLDTIDAGIADRFADGSTSWFEISVWSENVRIGERRGWRLPSDPNCGIAPCNGGEFFDLWATTLGNQVGGAVNMGPFQNVQFQGHYWLKQGSQDGHDGYGFVLRDGTVTSQEKKTLGYVMLVLDGDIATTVPEPSSVALFASSVIPALLYWRRRQSKISSSPSPT